jgi:hypothetical protein
MITPMYIDPGTGSMLFSIIMGAIATLYFLVGTAFFKLKTFALGGKVVKSVKNKFVIYGEDKRYFSLFEPILNEFERRKIPVLYLTSSEDDPAFGKNYEFVRIEFAGKGNKVFSRLNFLSADVVLGTTPSLDVFQWKRSKTVRHYCHIMHMVGGISTYRLFGIDYYDSILITGPAEEEEEIRELENVRNLPRKEVVVVGCPYLDTYAEKLNNISVEKNGKIRVLVSPSWGPDGLLAVYGDKILDNLVKYNYQIIIRPHPQSKTVEKELLDKLAEKYKDAADIEWDYNPDNIFSLARADIMISDFSGIIADYAFLLGRPVLYTGEHIDLRYYDAYWLKTKPIYLRSLHLMAKKFEADDIQRIGQVVEETLSDKGSSIERDKARDMFWTYRGEAGTRTVDFLVKKAKQIEGETTGTPEKIITETK